MKDFEMLSIAEKLSMKTSYGYPNMTDFSLLCRMQGVTSSDEVPALELEVEDLENVSLQYTCTNCNHQTGTLSLDCPNCNIPWTQVVFMHYIEGKNYFHCSTRKLSEIITFEELE